LNSAYFLPVLLLYFSCSDDSSDDLPETENNTFTVEYSQSGDNEQGKRIKKSLS